METIDGIVRDDNRQSCSRVSVPISASDNSSCKKEDTSGVRRHAYAGLRVAAVCLVVAASWFGLMQIGDTISYYTDTERSRGNIFTADMLDLELIGNTQQSAALSCGQEQTFAVHAQSAGDLATQYRVFAQLDTDKKLCKALDLSVKRPAHLDRPLYTGDLNGFSGTTTQQFGEWQFEILLPEDRDDIEAGAQCQVDFVFSAWRSDTYLYSDSGYTDKETLSLALRVASSTDTGSGDVTIINENNGTVHNSVTATSSTGGNVATSSGSVVTGNATSSVSITNTVNTNTTTVDTCSVCGSASSTVSASTQTTAEGRDDDMGARINDEAATSTGSEASGDIYKLHERSRGRDNQNRRENVSGETKSSEIGVKESSSDDGRTENSASSTSITAL